MRSEGGARSVVGYLKRAVARIAFGGSLPMTLEYFLPERERPC